MGPVIPLLAIAESYKKKNPDVQFAWVGTKAGPERELVEKHQIPFFVIGAGKWRRYFSVLNLFDIFKLVIAFFQSCVLIARLKPDLLISAGGFVSVPLHWAGSVFGVPEWAHQQDVKPGLSNRLVAPFASKITTALQESVKYFPEKRTEWIGNPSRDLSAKNSLESRKKFNISESAPVVLIMGGGTGSLKINLMAVEALQHWPDDWQIIHLVGRDRPKDIVQNASKIFINYHPYDFLADEMGDAYATADVVVSRAGFSSITELAELSKPTILVPMADTHQEDNAEYFAKKNAVVALNEKITDGLALSLEVKDLMDNSVRREIMGKKLHEILPPVSDDKIAEIINSLKK